MIHNGLIDVTIITMSQQRGYIYYSGPSFIVHIGQYVIHQCI